MNYCFECELKEKFLAESRKEIALAKIECEKRVQILQEEIQLLQLSLNEALIREKRLRKNNEKLNSTLKEVAFDESSKSNMKSLKRIVVEKLEAELKTLPSFFKRPLPDLLSLEKSIDSPLKDNGLFYTHRGPSKEQEEPLIGKKTKSLRALSSFCIQSEISEVEHPVLKTEKSELISKVITSSNRDLEHKLWSPKQFEDFLK